MDRPLMWGTYWAALVHDYEHGGLNNDFLIKTAHPLAITYSDQSPLEHHHVAAATRVFLEPKYMYFTVRSHTPSALLNAMCRVMFYLTLLLSNQQHLCEGCTHAKMTGVPSITPMQATDAMPHRHSISSTGALTTVVMRYAILPSLCLLEHSMYTRSCMLILAVTKSFQSSQAVLAASHNTVSV